MAESSIPVDPFNPGQVFACLGFLEAADFLLGDAEGGFDWSKQDNTRFVLRTDKNENAFEVVLEFIAEAQISDIEPTNWPGERSAYSVVRNEYPAPLRNYWNKQDKKWTRTALPVQLTNGDRKTSLTHWSDGSSRNPFKLYSGNRSAFSIATAMILGTRAKPRKGQNIGDLETRGVNALRMEAGSAFVDDPFGLVTPMGGSFNFDPRGGWNPIDAGYSPDRLQHQVSASPALEMLAAWGLENARPDEFESRKVRYAVWGIALPPILARAALCGTLSAIPVKRFHFELSMSGKNKVVTFAELESLI